MAAANASQLNIKKLSYKFYEASATMGVERIFEDKNPWELSREEIIRINKLLFTKRIRDEKLEGLVNALYSKDFVESIEVTNKGGFGVYVTVRLSGVEKSIGIGYSAVGNLACYGWDDKEVFEIGAWKEEDQDQDYTRYDDVSAIMNLVIKHYNESK